MLRGKQTRPPRSFHVCHANTAGAAVKTREQQQPLAQEPSVSELAPLALWVLRAGEIPKSGPSAPFNKRGGN